MVILPEVGGMNPVTMRMVVDLPAPFGPRKPSTSPRSTVNETSFTATFAPNAFTRFSTLIIHFLRWRSSAGAAAAFLLLLAQLCVPPRIPGAGHCDYWTGESAKVPPPRPVNGLFLILFRHRPVLTIKKPAALQAGAMLVPTVWIEQTTYRLQGGCSTTELCRPG